LGLSVLDLPPFQLWQQHLPDQKDITELSQMRMSVEFNHHRKQQVAEDFQLNTS
jgi:glutathione peroxidase-family protein